MIQFIKKNVRKSISQLPVDKIETKIISYLKAVNFKVKDVDFVVLKNISNNEQIEVEKENLINKFGTDKNGWN